jgi:hypothetical protein
LIQRREKERGRKKEREKGKKESRHCRLPRLHPAAATERATATFTGSLDGCARIVYIFDNTFLVHCVALDPTNQLTHAAHPQFFRPPRRQSQNVSFLMFASRNSELSSLPLSSSSSLAAWFASPSSLSS